jgi:hypothetical protein
MLQLKSRGARRASSDVDVVAESFGGKFVIAQSVVKIGPQLRFWRFRIRVLLILRNTIRRINSFSVKDEASESLRDFLGCFEHVCVYLPVDKPRCVAAAAELVSNAGLPCPTGFNAPTQYLLNSQLAHIAQRAARSQWTIDREEDYGMGSRYRADLRIRATPYRTESYRPFSIWFETDGADEITLRRKLGERISVIGQSDAYVSLVFANSEKKWPRIERTAWLLYEDMERKFEGSGKSFAVLHLDPPSLHGGVSDVQVDAHLLLEGNSVRVAEFHFIGDDLSVYNEFVTDENGIRYPHREPPRPRPKPWGLRSEFLGLG